MFLFLINDVAVWTLIQAKKEHKIVEIISKLFCRVQIIAEKEKAVRINGIFFQLESLCVQLYTDLLQVVAATSCSLRG